MSSKSEDEVIQNEIEELIKRGYPFDQAVEMARIKLQNNSFGSVIQSSAVIRIVKTDGSSKQSRPLQGLATRSQDTCRFVLIRNFMEAAPPPARRSTTTSLWKPAGAPQSGVTRAQEHVRVVGTEAAVRAAVAAEADRATGLRQRLNPAL